LGGVHWLPVTWLDIRYWVCIVILMLTDIKRSHLSTLLLVVFVLILGISASISEFFQAPMSEVRKLERYRHLFPTQRWVDLRSIQLANTLGTLTLSLEDKSWVLIDPRHLPANPLAVDRVIDELKQVVIKKIYPNDKINSSNFSLDIPLLTIGLTFVGGESRTVRVGLVNPVDNSTYVTLSGGRDAIYHINTLTNSLDQMSLADFIDSRIITIAPQKVQELVIYRGSKDRGRVRLKLTKNSKGEWSGPSSSRLSTTKIENFFTSMSSLRSHTILDRRTTKSDQQVKSILSRPLYTMELKGDKGESLTYLISARIKKLDGVKIEKRENYIISASNRMHPYLLHRKSLDLFAKREWRFR
jgi:hypothetical protein